MVWDRLFVPPGLAVTILTSSVRTEGQSRARSARCQSVRFDSNVTSSNKPLLTLSNKSRSKCRNGPAKVKTGDRFTEQWYDAPVCADHNLDTLL